MFFIGSDIKRRIHEKCINKLNPHSNVGIKLPNNNTKKNKTTKDSLPFECCSFSPTN